jgi:hypothetical protein
MVRKNFAQYSHNRNEEEQGGKEMRQRVRHLSNKEVGKKNVESMLLEIIFLSVV